MAPDTLYVLFWSIYLSVVGVCRVGGAPTGSPQIRFHSAERNGTPSPTSFHLGQIVQVFLLLRHDRVSFGPSRDSPIKTERINRHLETLKATAADAGARPKDKVGALSNSYRLIYTSFEWGLSTLAFLYSTYYRRWPSPFDRYGSRREDPHDRLRGSQLL